jgi:hypothetical protein
MPRTAPAPANGPMPAKATLAPASLLLLGAQDRDGSGAKIAVENRSARATFWNRKLSHNARKRVVLELSLAYQTLLVPQLGECRFAHTVTPVLCLRVSIKVSPLAQSLAPAGGLASIHQTTFQLADNLDRI